ncbi:MAG: DUF4384 domain-containing protein [Planctomycetota bacterium]|nr:DUF4384 domain-containing protein [Planctomycetota bacterium]
MKVSAGRTTVVLAASIGAACSAAEVVREVALETGRHLLERSITKNYGQSYKETVDRMFESVMVATLTPGKADADRAEVVQLASSEDFEAAPDAQEAAALLDEMEAVEAAMALEPIELEVAVLREARVEGRYVPIELSDGDTIRDGVGRADDGDNIKIRFEVNQQCHVYAVWVDATGWVTPIFPRSDAYSHVNPATPDLEYTLPEGSQWFFLDEHRGIENLYFVASHEAIPNLESAIEDLLGKERALQAELDAPIPVEEPYALMRGIGGTREGRLSSVRTSDDRTHDVKSQVFIAEFASSDLVITRWFRHE